MKIKFKFIGSETRISDNDYNRNSILPTHKPCEYILSFIEHQTGTMRVDITIDQTHRLAAVLANQNKNELFEFDFSQPLPNNRINQ